MKNVTVADLPADKIVWVDKKKRRILNPDVARDRRKGSGKVVKRKKGQR